jgi:hypothetical protein
MRIARNTRHPLRPAHHLDIDHLERPPRVTVQQLSIGAGNDGQDDTRDTYCIHPSILPLPRWHNMLPM